MSWNTSGVPPSPCSIVSTPASAARRIASAELAWAATGRPASCAAATSAASSAAENAGTGSPAALRIASA